MVECWPLKTRGPGFKYPPREIQPTLYLVVGLPDVIPLPLDQGLSSVVVGWYLKPAVWGVLKPAQIQPNGALYCVVGPAGVIPVIDGARTKVN